MHNPDEYVYVNQDGSVRELSNDERQCLAQRFEPSDGNRPYTKASYEAQDGWGSISGFLPRNKLPPHIAVEPINPSYVAPEYDWFRQHIEDSERVGDIVTKNPDGSIRVAPNPNITHQQRFERLREIQLEHQRQRERLARHPDYV